MAPAAIAAALVIFAAPSVQAGGHEEKHLKERLADLKALLERLPKKPEVRNDQIAELKATVTAQAGQIAELRAMISAQAGEIAALQTAISEIGTLRTALTEETVARKQAEADLLAAARGYSDQICSPLSEKLAHVSRQGNDIPSRTGWAT
jgi:septal ring factor EnvC (AmiA/AmiB activator)